MENFTELIRKYKAETNTDIKERFFYSFYKKFETTVEDKADFIYYRKWYPFNLFAKNKICKNCKESKKLFSKKTKMMKRSMNLIKSARIV